MTAPNIRVFLGTLERRRPPQGGNLRAQGVTHPASCGVTRKCSYGYFCSISHFERHVQSLTAFDPLQPPFPTLQVWTPRLRRFLGMPRVTWPANGRAQAFGFCRFLVFFSVLCGSCSVQVHRPLKEKWPSQLPLQSPTRGTRRSCYHSHGPHLPGFCLPPGCYQCFLLSTPFLSLHTH